MNQQAADNRAWVRARLEESGLLPGLSALAKRIRTGEISRRQRGPWAYNWAKAYSYGHNVLSLHNGRLAHFANSYADIAEEADFVAPEMEMTLEAFWLVWNEGATLEGTATEHWRFA